MYSDGTICTHNCGKRIHRATRYTQQEVAPLLNGKKDVICSEINSDGERIETFRELVKNYQS